MVGRQRLEVLDDDGAAVRIAVRLTGIAQQRGRIEVAGMERRPAVEDPRGPEQAVHDVGDALHGAADAGTALGGVRGVQAVLHLDEPLRVTVDDGERRAELVGSHGDEIALLLHQAPLVLEARLERGRLLEQAALAGHEGDRVVAEHGDGARHLADLIAARNARDRDRGIVIGQPAHARRELHERREDAREPRTR